MSRRIRGLAVLALLAISVASPAFAYGKETYQVAFSGTATQPGVGGFGFWGWCAFAGGVTSGNDGDCEFSQYNHGLFPGASVTCEESLDVSSWSISPVTGDFVITGTVTVHPSTLSSSQMAACLALFPGSGTFSNVDSEIPARPGHYNIGNVFGTATGEFEVQVVKIQ